MDSILSFQHSLNTDFYSILGCDELSSVEQIMAEYKARVLTCHPDKNLDDSHAGKRFSELQRAKDVLTDPKQRQDYDKWRRSGMAMSYDEWRARKANIETSMHWAMKKKKEPMLEEGPSTKSDDGEHHLYDNWLNTNWKREPANDIIQAFRNYDI